MTRPARFALGGALLVVALAVVLPAAVMAGPDDIASVQFGNADRGSNGDVGPGIPLHDASPNAQFNLVPRTAVVAAGGTVQFTVGVAGSPSNKAVPHQVAVCKLGVGLDDVNVPASGMFINDLANCPVVGPELLPPPAPRPPLGLVVEKEFAGSGFTEPGRYLVLCNIRPHFVEFKMYGWVNVK